MSLASKLFESVGQPTLGAVLEETIIHYPLGNLDAGVEVQALVALDNELGTNEMVGDGAITQNDSGDKERRSGHIEVPVALTVTAKEDLWRIQGELYTTQRRTGKDQVYQGWLVTSNVPRYTQHSLNVRSNRPVKKG